MFPEDREIKGKERGDGAVLLNSAHVKLVVVVGNAREIARFWPPKVSFAPHLVKLLFVKVLLGVRIPEQCKFKVSLLVKALVEF